MLFSFLLKKYKENINVHHVDKKVFQHTYTYLLLLTLA